MKVSRQRRCGRMVVAWWLFSASGCADNGSHAVAPDAGMDAGGRGRSGRGPAGSRARDAGDAHVASGMPDASSADAATDAGCHDGGCVAPDACADGGCAAVDECADPNSNDCGDATCMTTASGHQCVCDRHATFAAGSCSCDLTGTFAVRTQASLSWEDSRFGPEVVIEGGTAETVGAGLLTITRDGAVLEGELKNCGVDAPDLCSPFFSEAYGQAFPKSIWDSGSIPTQSLTLELDSEAPGAMFSTAPTAAFLGFRFASGVDPLGTFPMSAVDPALVWMDDDDDGVSGVTSILIAPGPLSDRCNLHYAYLPVDPALARAKRVQLGLRTISHLQGTIDDCDLLTGELITDAADGRVYGCTLASDSPCSPSQADFLDTQAKGQSVGPATFVMLRLASADATCEDARTAPFPK